MLVGLSRADMNGQLATITELSTRKDPERAGVRLDATGKVVAICRTNLRASPDEEHSSAAGLASDGQMNCATALLKEGHALLQRGDPRGALPKYKECRCAFGWTISDSRLALQMVGMVKHGKYACCSLQSEVSE